jgi:hypothetical protein
MNSNLEDRLTPLAYPIKIEGTNYVVGTENLRFDKENRSPPQIRGRVYADKVNENRFLRLFKPKKRIFQSTMNLTSVCRLDGFESFYTTLIHLADKFPGEFKEKDLKYFEKLFLGIYQHYKNLG